MMKLVLAAFACLIATSLSMPMMGAGFGMYNPMMYGAGLGMFNPLASMGMYGAGMFNPMAMYGGGMYNPMAMYGMHPGMMGYGGMLPGMLGGMGSYAGMGSSFGANFGNNNQVDTTDIQLL